MIYDKCKNDKYLIAILNVMTYLFVEMVKPVFQDHFMTKHSSIIRISIWNDYLHISLCHSRVDLRVLK